MEVLANFEPPDAQNRFREWRDDHAEVLAGLPDDAVRIDVGRAVGGDFVRVSVDEAYVDRFASARE